MAEEYVGVVKEKEKSKMRSACVDRFDPVGGSRSVRALVKVDPACKLLDLYSSECNNTHNLEL